MGCLFKKLQNFLIGLLRRRITLYAAVDRDDYHVKDLFALKPTEDDMEMAARWVVTQDVSEVFKALLKDFLERNHYGNIAQRI